MAEQQTISGEPGDTGRVDGRFKVAEECPLQRVLAIRENGLVLESARAFEVGSAMVLGCHVDRRDSLGESGFVGAEVMVVESRVMAEGEQRYQVTGMFSEIANKDREMLLALPNADGIRLSRSQGGVDGCFQRAGLAIPPPEVYSISQPEASAPLPGESGAAKPVAEESGGVGGMEQRQSSCSLN